MESLDTQSEKWLNYFFKIKTAPSEIWKGSVLNQKTTESKVREQQPVQQPVLQWVLYKVNNSHNPDRLYDRIQLS